MFLKIFDLLKNVCILYLCYNNFKQIIAILVENLQTTRLITVISLSLIHITLENYNMRIIILFAILFLTSCSTNINKTEKIRVSGEGKVRVMPNLVILTLNISFTQPRMVDAVRQTQETIDSVLLILEKFGRKDLDIKTSSISANKAYEYIGNTNKFVGYQAQQTIDFVLNDISKFTELTGKLLETKINSISQIQFNHSSADSLLRG